ncbi:hypothetical protein BCV70DRAFT_233160 [Testicularia cyperi]|uniref:Uncharacterized protein n=1 Tax=Testicularia cyperi TaxID=1882483 RepID=A0A317XIU9_9BASI|nr:hypothetical protein BCV70DRAFT_233160 [Testicularia cyperi]
MPTVGSSHIAGADAPSYISARSANSLISESRPTRIQAEALLVLNRFLDELLLLVLSSAKSLATNRIKTDGVLKVLNNNLLAKDAVLEAELELRSYMEGKRAEGAKVPLGLMATSRLDGTENFPVNSAYNALRIRCQYYSTLGDQEDDNAGTDQNIMSADGRPIATITPGVAIYVTALLEFIGEHILKNVARVIERDNSDEASLYDLRAAIIEDELLFNLFNRMAMKEEVTRRIELLEGRRRKVIDDGSGRSGIKTDARAVKPWQVPTEHEFDEAAGPGFFSSASAKRSSVQILPRRASGAVSASKHERTASSSTAFSSVGRHGSAGNNSVSTSARDSIQTSTTSASIGSNTSTATTVPSSYVGTFAGASGPNASGSDAGQGMGTGAGMTGSVGRRQSSERGWSGVFGNMKRRNSIRQNSDATSGSFAKTLLTPDTVAPPTDATLDPDDDFEALMLSGQTMKVSLTPNRLRTIEVAKEAEANKNAARRRPGTATLNTTLRDDAAITPPVSAPASAPANSMRNAQQNGANISSTSLALVDENASSGHSSPGISAGSAVNGPVRRPSSRASLQAPARPEKKFSAPPPSSYRSPSPAVAGMGMSSSYGRDSPALKNGLEDDSASQRAGSQRSLRRLQPRESQGGERVATSQELAELFRSTPPSSHQETFSGPAYRAGDQDSYDGSKKSGVGDRVRNLFGRKSSSQGHGSVHALGGPSSSPRRPSMGTGRNDSRPSYDGSHDTSVTSDTNSVDRTRSVVSPIDVSSTTGQHVASRSSTSTWEHPPMSAHAAGVIAETKPSPGVIVTESTTRDGGRGSLVAAGAASITSAVSAASVGTVAAIRNASVSSRSPSQTQSIPETIDESSSTTPATNEHGLVGLYQETSTGTNLEAQPSPMLKPKVADELPSRKIPWGYKRNSSSTSTGHAFERNATPTSDRRRSIGYTSSNGHGSLAVKHGASGSDHGHYTVSPLVGGDDATAHSPLMMSGYGAGTRRGSAAQESTATASRAPSALARRSSEQSDHVLLILAELESAMRMCSSADECRELVMRAIQVEAIHAASINGNDSARESGRNPSALGVVGTKTKPAPANGESTNFAAPVVAAGNTRGASPPAKDSSTSIEGVVSATRIAPHETDTHSNEVRPPVYGNALEDVDQGLVVAWLLGGGDLPAEAPLQQPQASPFKTKSIDAYKTTTKASPMAPTTASVTDDAKRSSSLDSQMNTRESTDETRMPSSSVVSLLSNYRDASEDIGHAVD